MTQTPSPSFSFEEAIGDFLVASRKCEVVSLERLLEAVQLVGRIRALVHQLQRERGASSLWIGSGGQRYADELAQYRAESDTTAQAFREHLDGWLEPGACAHARSRLLGRMALALHGLSGLPSLRAEVSERTLSPMEAMRGFSELIRSLLAVVFEAADSATDPEVSRALVALLNFMQGKELAGQERAIGAAGFGQGVFDGELRQSLLHRIDAQERSFRIFSEFAPKPACAAWQELQGAGFAAEVERLRRQACTHGDLRGDPLPDPARAETWFACTTARIDAMKEIEDLLEMHLNECCSARITADRADLGAVRDRVEQLAESELRDSVPYAVFFGAPEGLESTQEEGETVLNVPIVGHSVMDLVQRQATRLQSVEDELHAARQALDERKTIERAKALLIQHRGLSEDQAYKLLRQTAMNQNRRLAEVAEATVAMSDLLGKGGL
ncbi:ANTAR domain protein with unknown sensor [Thioalkalivibrio sp. K90mix]|uniref:nitrate regulatory protein n=1 Tax=Thioalkalivibrio sp. (strain K90mix) TaxID=396595 RepID=UPI000195AB51|nr:nitrate regulatory protein [Thioalkalivibrio sp. K90mix]ADC71179.1 ANTAR domain protein with unknown sensor [Thioalkalivibrio sp. K90mix]